MSAKLLYSIADDNPSVRKQIGCMNGLFQLFDRHHFLSSRRISRDTHKRIPEGQGCKHEFGANESAQRPAPARNAKAVREKHRVLSTDSSRSSVSSSCNTSSFSSLEDTQSVKSERAERRPSLNQNSSVVTSKRSGRQHLTAHRDVRGITVKPGSNNEQSTTLTYIDSPRPMPMQKPNKNTKARFSNLQESLGVFPNFRKLRTSLESIEHSRKDSPRLSYDGRELRDASMSNARLKELPRHSLDSKRGTTIGSSQVFHKDLAVDSPLEVGKHRRQSSVVAKLMGLEAFPDSMSSTEERDDMDWEEASDTSRMSNGSLGSTHQGDAIFCQVIHPTFPKKPNPGARFPMEPAPWKKLDGKQSTEAPQNGSRSVYGEIEKRLAQIEFKKSGKDLRALKQILEAMQKSHDKLNSPKEVSNPNISHQSPSRNNDTERRSNLAAVPRNIIRESPSFYTARRTSSPESLASSIVIMKPAAMVKKLTNVPRSEDRTSPRKCSGGRNVPTDRNLTSRETIKEAVSPRLHKKSGPADISQRRSSQSSKPRRSSGVPHRNHKSMTSNLRRGDNDQGSESLVSRDLTERNNSVSLQSESNSSWEEAEVTSAYRRHCGTPRNETSKWKDDSVATGIPQINTAEQPSPISVLDAAALYGEESPSPVKTTSNAFEEVGGQSLDESRWDQEDPKSSPIEINRSNALSKVLPVQNGPGINSGTIPDHSYISEILLASDLLRGLDYHSMSFRSNPPSSSIFNKKLFLALEQIKTAGNRFSDQLQDVPRFNCTDKLQRRLMFDVVNEILAEKFIRSHPNYRVRVRLEQRKSSQEQLLHGLCSEIDQLQAKGSTIGSDEENDGFSHIMEKEISKQSAVWADGFREISGVVLDIERSIFKDLIGEVISGAAGHILRAQRYCRQLRL